MVELPGELQQAIEAAVHAARPRRRVVDAARLGALMELLGALLGVLRGERVDPAAIDGAKATLIRPFTSRALAHDSFAAKA